MIPVIRSYECVRIIFGINQGRATGMTQSCPYPRPPCGGRVSQRFSMPADLRRTYDLGGVCCILIRIFSTAGGSCDLLVPI